MIDYRRLGIVSALVLALVMVSWAKADAQLKPATAEISRVAGRVEVLRQRQSQWSPAQAGQRLAEGDQIRAFGGGSAELSTQDGSTILVAENTRFAVTKLEYDQATGARNNLFHLVAGKVVANVKRAAVELVRARQSNFAISTPTGVAAVRGTVATILYNPETQQVLVLIQPSPGEPASLAQAVYVNLRTGQTQVVSGNQFITQTANNPPSVPQGTTTLSPQSLTQLTTAVNTATAGSAQITAATISVVTPAQMQNALTGAGIVPPPATLGPPSPVVTPIQAIIGRDVTLTCSSPPCP